MFDPEREIELETDLSNYALGGQIGQRDDAGKLYPIAFYLYKLHDAELQYPIYNKEFLAIINCFKEFRYYLIGSKYKVKLRYIEYLYEFDFIIIYRKGLENGRADAISRQPDYNTGTIKANKQVLKKNKKGEYVFTQQMQTLG
ncbi:uncharacterized protein FFE2_15559 [Fusarium fujikuroi]|nr:uncharacterized protein FFE2_15559 [Fusarium fujikuroi]